MPAPRGHSAPQHACAKLIRRQRGGGRWRGETTQRSDGWAAAALPQFPGSRLPDSPSSPISSTSPPTSPSPPTSRVPQVPKFPTVPDIVLALRPRELATRGLTVLSARVRKVDGHKPAVRPWADSSLMARDAGALSAPSELSWHGRHFRARRLRPRHGRACAPRRASAPRARAHAASLLAAPAARPRLACRAAAPHPPSQSICAALTRRFARCRRHHHLFVRHASAVVDLRLRRRRPRRPRRDEHRHRAARPGGGPGVARRARLEGRCVWHHRSPPARAYQRRYQSSARREALTSGSAFPS